MASDSLEPSFEDTQDSENANRGFIAKLDPCVIKDATGRPVWNNDAYSFLEGECPPTANPKLWRHSRLSATQGLFEVTSGVYQVRGLDISNMTIIEGQSGLIIVDPLTSIECARTALDLYRKNRPGSESLPVVAVIYSHSHSDHYDGALGVLPEPYTGVRIIAPRGFIEEATSENVECGPAMRRRARYMYGTHLPKAPDGQIGCGIGTCVSVGSGQLIPPNTLVTQPDEEMEIDGVKFIFQMVSGTEAPSEFNFYLPDKEALYISECATHTLHNIITLRGALVRDAKAWYKYLDDTVEKYCRRSKVLFAGHHWPTWGTDEIVALVSEQSDLYEYLHNETVRLLNRGLNGSEIAEIIKLPPKLQRAWHAQDFYGSASHNVKGIYQRYMTWFDGNPASLWPHPPSELGRRYVECFGGIGSLVEKANQFVKAGDLRFAATLLDHAVKADPTNVEAKMALANVFERLGHGAVNSTWRNFYLTGAMDLRSGSPALPQLSVLVLNPLAEMEQWLDILSIRMNGPEAAKQDEPLILFLRDTEKNIAWRLRVRNGVLAYRELTDRSKETPSSLVVAASKEELRQVLLGNVELARSKAIRGNCNALYKLLELCEISMKPDVGAAHKL